MWSTEITFKLLAQDVVNIGSQCVHLTSGFYVFVLRGSRFRRLGFVLRYFWGFSLGIKLLRVFFCVDLSCRDFGWCYWYTRIFRSLFFFSLIISSGTAVILWQANLFLGCTTVIVIRVSKQRSGILFLNNAMQETLKTHTEAYAYFMHTPLSWNENDQIYCHMVVKKNIAYTEL